MPGYQPKEESCYLSDQGVYEVSKDKNVIVFVLDMFDENYFKEIFRENPWCAEELDGFTFFRNATCGYSTTGGSIPFMLTGEYYENDKTYHEYLDEAFDKASPFYEELKKNGFSVNLFTDKMFLSQNFIKEIPRNSEQGEAKVRSNPSFEKKMLQFTACRYFPHIAKKLVWFYGEEFDNEKDTGSMSATEYNWESNIPFFNTLRTEGLKTADGSVFSFIHLDGAHFPYTRNEENVASSEQTDAITEAKSSLNLVFEYLKNLKKLNLYENSLIVVTSDHGYTSDVRTSPVLLIKRFQEHGTMKISDAPVSHEDLLGTIAKELNLSSDYGVSMYEVKENDRRLRRYMSYSAEDDSLSSGYLPDLMEYMVLPEGNDQDQFIFTGKNYTKNGLIETEAYRYSPGTKIVFTEENDGRSYFLCGISNIEGDYAWSCGEKSGIMLKIDTEKDLFAEIALSSVYHDRQRVIISDGNDTVLFDGTADRTGLTFSIPKESLSDGTLLLKFVYPEASSPQENGESMDTRVLAIAFTSILISEQ